MKMTFDVLFCSKRFKDIHVPSFELNDDILPRVNKCKYLGHVITDDPKYDNDIARQYTKENLCPGECFNPKVLYVFRSCKV